MGTPQASAGVRMSAEDDEMRLREAVSRWMDGDLDGDDTARIMHLLCTDRGRAIWAELHAVGDCVRGLHSGAVDHGTALTARICSAVAAEPPIVAPAARRERLAREHALTALLNRLGRGGRAWAAVASVAAVGLVSTAAWQGWREAPGGTASLASGGAPAPAGLQPVAAPPTAGSPIDWAAYMRAHQESADSTSIYPVRQYLRPVSNLPSE